MKTQCIRRPQAPALCLLTHIFVIALSAPSLSRAQELLLPSAPAPQLSLQAKLATPLAEEFKRFGVPGEATAPAQAAGAPPAPALQIVILEGENVLNNIKDRTAREPIIQVQDENHKPVAGASVIFTIQNGSGHAGAAFTHGATTFTGQTDSTGRLVAHGFRPNAHVGQFHIAVSASKGQLLTHTVIVQQNVVAASAVSASTGVVGVVTTHIALVSAVTAGVVAGAVVTGVVLTRNNTSNISSSTGSVGAPQGSIRIHLGSH